MNAETRNLRRADSCPVKEEMVKRNQRHPDHLWQTIAPTAFAGTWPIYFRPTTTRASRRRFNDCHTRAEAFSARLRFSMEHPETLTADSLLDALKELEIIYEALGRVGSYAGLLYAADTANPDYQNLEQRVEQRSTEIRNLLLFFEIQWLKADDTIAKRLIGDPALKTYSHYLESLRRFRPHTLTEPEEKILNEKDNTGRNAFGRLFSEMTSSLTFALDKDGKQEDLNLSQVLSLLHEPNRALRQRAMDAALRRSFPTRPGAHVYLRHSYPRPFDHG